MADSNPKDINVRFISKQVMGGGCVGLEERKYYLWFHYLKQKI